MEEEKDNKKGGQKFDKDKLPITLVSPKALLHVAKILQFGANRYGRWNWAQGLLYSRVADALLRHLLSWLDGQDIDPDSGENHIYHVLCNAIFLSHFVASGSQYDQFDDRPSNDKQDYWWI